MPSVALTHTITRSTNTLFSPSEGEREGLTLDEGEADAEGESDFDALLDAEALGEREGELDSLGLGEDDGLELGDWEALCETEGDCEWLVSNSPSSSIACPQERVSTAFRISIFDANLKDPLPVPTSAQGEMPSLKDFIS